MTITLPDRCPTCGCRAYVLDDDGDACCWDCARPVVAPGTAKAAEAARLLAEARAAPGIDRWRGRGRPPKNAARATQGHVRASERPRTPPGVSGAEWRPLRSS